MKKIVGTIAAVALIAASAFADVGIGAWGRGLWAPVASDAKDTVTMMVPSWVDGAWGSYTTGPRVGISIHGESDNVGFNIDMNGDGAGSTINGGDTKFIWVKPFDMVELQMGKIQDNSARGDGCFGAFNWLRNSSMASVGEDFTFIRFGDGKGSQAFGTIVKVTPMDALWIEACFNLDNGAGDDYGIKYAYGQSAQYGAGYKIDGIGHIRAQIIMEPKVGDKNQSTFNAAFDLTAVENLFVTVGAKMFIGREAFGDQAMNINLYGNYKVSAMTIHAIFALVTFTSDTKNYDGNNFMNMMFGAGLDYDLGDGLTVVADFRAGINNAVKDDKVAVSFMAGITKGFSNGLIGIAFQGTTDETAQHGFYHNAVEAAKDGNAFAWQLPIRVEYWF